MHIARIDSRQAEIETAYLVSTKRVVDSKSLVDVDISVNVERIVNALFKYDATANKNEAFERLCVDDLVRLFAPFAPHTAEEFWEILGHKNSVFEEAYPVADESALVREETEYAVQINSKIKCKMMVAKDSTDEEIRAAACAREEIAPLLEGKTVKKCVIVPGRLVNLIVA